MTAEQAFDDHHQAVYRFVYRLTGREDVAEDITQDCFLSILRKPNGWDANRGSLKTYLFSIAQNLARKRSRDDHTAQQVDDGQALTISANREDRELAVVVAQMVAQLPDLQREALILFEYEGLQLQEISLIVNADVGVVKSRLHRARERLRRALAPYGKVGTRDSV